VYYRHLLSPPLHHSSPAPPQPHPRPHPHPTPPQADVINRGFGGYTTKQAALIQPEMLEGLDMKRTALAVVWWGANDAVNPEGPQ
jgi:hypothetical protein